MALNAISILEVLMQASFSYLNFVVSKSLTKYITVPKKTNFIGVVQLSTSRLVNHKTNLCVIV